MPLLVHEGHDVFCVCRGKGDFVHVTPELDQVTKVYLGRGEEGFEQRVAELGCDVVVDIICFTKAEAERMALALAGSVKHYVAVGSIWIRGPAVCVPTFEDECRNPMDAYGIGKLELTDYLMDLSKREGFPATVVHPGHIVTPGYSSIVGPQGNRNTDVIEALREGREVLLPNLGLETIHPVHVADVAGIIDAVIRTGSPTFGQEYHAVSQRAITLRGFCQEVARLYGKEANLRFVSLDEFRLEVGDDDVVCTLEHIFHSPSCSPIKAERELGYVTKTTMETIEEHLEALGLLKRW